MKVDKEVYNYLNYELSQYERYKKEFQALYKEITEGPFPAHDPISHMNTRRISAGLIKALKHTISTTEDTLRDLSEEHNHIFREVYCKNRKDFESIAMEMNISGETFRRRRRDIIYAFGAKSGIIKG
jgi:hypothetical protein